jgi:hypothetical protein
MRIGFRTTLRRPRAIAAERGRAALDEGIHNWVNRQKDEPELERFSLGLLHDMPVSKMIVVKSRAPRES